ncbi:MAG TPA: hypothetical protein VFW47_02025 [Phenylobacterium sp.]|nr:hypothetical protein [Phenylobacterium sp.]
MPTAPRPDAIALKKASLGQHALGDHMASEKERLIDAKVSNGLPKPESPALQGAGRA